jgi:hypothetical protein
VHEKFKKIASDRSLMPLWTLLDGTTTTLLLGHGN